MKRLEPSPSFRVASEAQEALKGVFGEEALADGEISAEELANADLTVDMLEAVGVAPDSVINAPQGAALEALAYAVGPGDSYLGDPAAIRAAAKALRDRGQALATGGRGTTAFAAYSAAANILRRAAQDGQIEKEAAEPDTHAAAQLLLNHEGIPKRLRDAYADARSKLAQLGWHEPDLDTATVMLAGRRGSIDLCIKNMLSLPAFIALVNPNHSLEVYEILEYAKGLQSSASPSVLADGFLEPANKLLAVCTEARSRDALSFVGVGLSAMGAYGNGQELSISDVCALVDKLKPDLGCAADILSTCSAPGVDRACAVETLQEMFGAGWKGDKAPAVQLACALARDKGGSLRRAALRAVAASQCKSELSSMLFYGFSRFPKADGKEMLRLASLLAHEGCDMAQLDLAMTLVASGSDYDAAAKTVRKALEHAHKAGVAEALVVDMSGLGGLIAAELCKGASFGDLDGPLKFAEQYVCTAKGRPSNDRYYSDLAAFRALAALKVGLTAFSEKGFAGEVANAINAASIDLASDDAGVRQRCQQALAPVTSMINQVHDREHALRGKDAIRTATIKALTPASAYTLIALANESAYPSTHRALMAQLPSGPGVKETTEMLRRCDPTGVCTTRYLFALGRFQEREVFVRSREVLLPVVFDHVLATKDRDVDQPDVLDAPSRMKWASRFLPLLQQSWPVLSAREREALEERLVWACSENQSDLNRRAVAAMALRYLYEQNAALSEGAKARAAGLPPIVYPEPPIKEWLADGVIAARLHFYPDEESFAQAKSFFSDQGFARNKKYEAAHAMRKHMDVVYERVHHGVTERVILSMSADAATKSADFVDASLDILGHRGHSYHFNETFPPGSSPQASHTKLIFGGSCNSFDSITSPDFLDSYRGHQYLGDKDTGEGMINNAVLLKIMDGVADGKGTWKEMGLDAYEEQRGIVLPNDPAIVGFAYASELMVCEGAPPNPGDSPQQ